MNTGPIPKRSEERRRQNKVGETHLPLDGAVTVPPASRTWHVMARDWYQSLKKSGQSQYYEPSDWQLAKLVAEMMTVMLNSGRPSSMMFAEVMRGMDTLLVSEGSRRRARLEIDRKQPETEAKGENVIAMYKEMLGS